jgi:hypothetical protein
MAPVAAQVLPYPLGMDGMQVSVIVTTITETTPATFITFATILYICGITIMSMASKTQAGIIVAGIGIPGPLQDKVIG